jgi:hypothetical protein
MKALMRGDDAIAGAVRTASPNASSRAAYGWRRAIIKKLLR